MTDLPADEKVNAWILDKFRADEDRPRKNESTAHLLDCPDATVRHAEGDDGLYGCDTGCEYLTLTATIACPHDFTFDYEYGNFGDIGMLIEDINLNRTEYW